MTDVLKIALDRRAELHEEIAKLDEFIRIAEGLIRNAQSRSVEDLAASLPGAGDGATGDAEPGRPPVRRELATTVATEISRPSVIRRGSAGAV